MTQPIQTIPASWFVLPVTICLLLGIPFLTILPLITWNGLVSIRNHFRYESY